MTAPGMHHDALLYDSDEQFVHEVGSFVRRGVLAGEETVVVEPPRQIDLLRAELGEHAPRVQFFDMTDIGENPARIINVWRDLLDAATQRGSSLRGVGEPAFVGRSDQEFAECGIHEHLLNAAFGNGMTWKLLCPYDRERLPAIVLDAAMRTHPCVVGKDGHGTSGVYAEDYTRVFGGELTDPPAEARRIEFGAGLGAVRTQTAEYGRGLRLSPDGLADLELIASELATNSVRYGGGGGVLTIWVDGPAIVVEASDDGLLLEPMVGRLRPDPGSRSGRGLFIVNQLCQLLQIRSGAKGTRVRARLRSDVDGAEAA